MSQAELPVGENTENEIDRQAAGQLEDKDDRYRRLEREWQNEVGHELLDGPHEDIGSARVFKSQFHRIIEEIDLTQSGLVAEIGCGKGHFLAESQAAVNDPGG